VETTSAEARYLAGYNAGRTACLRTGSVDAARVWVAEHQQVDAAYLAGYEWALWDYEDANGVPHTRRTSSGGGPSVPTAV
jgi:hypothetical protein